MANSQHPYRRRLQYTIEILHVPVSYPLKELEKEVRKHWPDNIDSCRILTNDSDKKGTYIFYINFSRERDALECVDFLRTSGYLTEGMWIREKVREADQSPNLGGERQRRGMGRGHVPRHARNRGRGYPEPDPSFDAGYDIPDIPKPAEFANIRFPKPKPDQEYIIHVRNISAIIDEEIFRKNILSNSEGVKRLKLRDDPSDHSLKEALIYAEDESNMNRIIANLNRVKVGGITLEAKPFKANQRPKNDPSDYISPLDPQEERVPSQKETFVQKTVKMSVLLFNFIETKKKTQLDVFSNDGGVMHHESDILSLKSQNINSLNMLYAALTTEVCERVQTFGREDFAFLTTCVHPARHNLVETKCSPYMSTDQLRFSINHIELTLHVFGIKECVDTVLNQIENSLYYHFYLKSPMDIFISVFPGLIQEILGASGCLRENEITIQPNVGLEECKKIRESIRNIQDSIICEPCMNFPVELITAGLKFCKQKHLRVAIIFKDIHGVLYKKYQQDSVVTLCGIRAPLLAANKTFSNPISCKMLATRKGLQMITQKSGGRGPSLTKGLEQEFVVCIKLLPDSVDVIGFIKDDVDKAAARIRDVFDNLEVFLSQFIHKYQVDFFLEARRFDVQWTMDMLSELELDYDVELLNTGQDYRLKGNQEALQKVETDTAQIVTFFKDIILKSCSAIEFDKLSRDFINALLLKFFEYQFNNENMFVSYRWKLFDSRTKSSALDVTIDLFGRSIDVHQLASKMQDFKPVTSKLKEKFSQNELQQLEAHNSTFSNIMATEFITFQRKSNQIEFHSLGISSKKPGDIFDSIMSDQDVVRSMHISPTVLYFLRSKKLLKDCESLTNCTIVEETKERNPDDRNWRQGAQRDRNLLTVKGKHTDVKAALDKLKNWLDTFTSKSISKNISSKMKNFFSRELESLKKELEHNQILSIDIRDARKALSGRSVENEEPIEISIRIQSLDKHTCEQYADTVEQKLELVASDEYPLTERQLTLLVAATKDHAIPRDQHFHLDIEFKQRRTGSARILAIQHYREAIQRGVEATAPYLQFQDRMYSPPVFLRELLFHWRRYTESININTKTLGVECARPSHFSGSYKLSGNPSAIQKMIFNLKTFEANFVTQCDRLECEINIPLKELKSDQGYANLERDIMRHCYVKIFMCGELPDDIESQVNLNVSNCDWDCDGTSVANRTYCAYRYSNRTIEVMKGDITKLEVDCIVNAANAKLEHDGGVAKAISEAGGPTIQKGCTKYIAEKGSLPVGGAVLQGSGHLLCTKLIHVSSALWDPMDQKTCVDQLKNCVATVFQLCETHELASVAIPGISTGNYGFPAHVSTKAVLQESKEYLDANPLSLIQRLIFIDINDKIVDSYNSDCQKQFGLETKLNSFTNKLPITKRGPVYPSLPTATPRQFVSTNTSSQGPVVEFYWKENDGHFYTYGNKFQDILKAAYKTNPLGSASFQRGEYTYAVDFSTLKQTNTSTNVERTIKIQHTVDPNTTPLPKPTPLPANIDSDEADLYCYWYFFNEHNQWVPYAHDITKKLSDAYLNNPQGSFVISQVNFSYHIDFKTMKQTNQESGTVRSIKADKNKLESAMGNLAITSSENVTLFGIQENMNLAKNKLDRFIRLKCTSKELPIHNIPKTVMISTIIKLKRKYSHVKIELQDSGEDYVIKLDGFKAHVTIVENQLKDVYIKSLEDVQKQDRLSQAKFPDNWEAHASNETIRVVPLVNNSPEWVRVAAQFNQSSRRTIRSIERVQNKWLWKKYQQIKDSFKEIEMNENELTVFHGTRTTDPELIYKGSEGFDFRHSSQGMWGKANYFAVNASFCESYQYTDPVTNANKILQVKLLAGNVIHSPANSSLTMPPLLPNSLNQHFVGQRYDTVSGDHSAGSKIYMVYTNERAYPEYLITYS